MNKSSRIELLKNLKENLRFEISQVLYAYIAIIAAIMTVSVAVLVSVQDIPTKTITTILFILFYIPVSYFFNQFKIKEKEHTIKLIDIMLFDLYSNKKLEQKIDENIIEFYKTFVFKKK